MKSEKKSERRVTVYIYQESGACMVAVAYFEGHTITLKHHDERVLRFLMFRDLKSVGFERDQITFEVDSGEFVVKIIGAASGAKSVCEGQYILSFDKDAAGGRGYLETISSRERAKVFLSKFSFFELWKNSSLKAFTVSIEPKEVKR
jgi:hypothetical protein